MTKKSDKSAFDSGTIAELGDNPFLPEIQAKHQWQRRQAIRARRIKRIKDELYKLYIDNAELESKLRKLFRKWDEGLLRAARLDKTLEAAELNQLNDKEPK